MNVRDAVLTQPRAAAHPNHHPRPLHSSAHVQVRTATPPHESVANRLGAHVLSFDSWSREAAVLFVDDDAELAEVMVRVLRAEGFERVETVTQAHEAVERYRKLRPDLVVLDYHMPSVNGVALLEELRSLSNPQGYVPFLMLTADISVETKKRALVFGAHDFLIKPLDPFELGYRIRNALRTRYLNLKLQEEKLRLEQTVAERVAELQRSQVEILDRLAVASDYRDDETGNHNRRVGHIAKQVALRIGLDSMQAQLIGQAAQLHDIGKIGISDEILLDPGELTPERFEKMKRHTIIGGEILSGGVSELMLLAEQIARCHHERWNGSGYPRGLRGDEIPLAARIVAVADVFDALTHARRYRAAVPVPEVIEIVRGESGAHFDPEVVRAFLEEVDGLGHSV